MVKTTFKKYDLIHELNGRYTWDVKCANCQKLISTSTPQLSLHGNCIFENVAAKIQHLFCCSSCKNAWLESHNNNNNNKKKKNTIKKKKLKIPSNGGININKVREILNAKVQFFFEKEHFNNLNLCIIEDLNTSQLEYLKAVVEEQLKNV